MQNTDWETELKTIESDPRRVSKIVASARHSTGVIDLIELLFVRMWMPLGAHLNAIVGVEQKSGESTNPQEDA